MKSHTLGPYELIEEVGYGGMATVYRAHQPSVERDVAVTTPAFCDVNLRLAYDLRVYKEITLQLYGGVQNLFNAYQKDFDKGVDRDSGYIYGPSLPRSWFIGAKVSF